MKKQIIINPGVNMRDVIDYLAEKEAWIDYWDISENRLWKCPKETTPVTNPPGWVNFIKTTLKELRP